MLRASRIVRHQIVVVVVVLVGALAGSRAAAQTVDVSLNVFYNNPTDDQSGGTWQIVAKTSSDTFGIAALNLLLTDVAVSGPAPQPAGPRGIVNGIDPAGFAEFDVFQFGQYQNVILGQHPLVPGTLGPGEEQGIFYGVGSFANGQPGDIGPEFTTLSNLVGSPWAAGGDVFGNATWNKAALFATGTFLPGATPGFLESTELLSSSANVFTALGTSIMAGTQSTIDPVTTIVRTNLGGNPDYSRNGIVDAADYAVWRDTLGRMGVGLVADGNLNGMVDQGDYEFWKLNFGLVIPGAGSGAGISGLGANFGVPEPATVTLLAGAAGIVFLRRRFRVLRIVNTA
jgi:hypothetical protein